MAGMLPYGVDSEASPYQHIQYIHTTPQWTNSVRNSGVNWRRFAGASDLPSYMVDQGQRSYYERPKERIYITIILKKVFHMHFAWLVQFNFIECIQAIYTFFILDVEKGKNSTECYLYKYLIRWWTFDYCQIVQKIYVRILSSRYIVLKYWTTYFYS